MPVHAAGALRRLPLVPVPSHGESFASWIDRLASDLRISRPEAWMAIGLVETAQRLPVRYGVELSLAAAANLTHTTGVKDATPMLLAQFDHGVVDLATLDAHRSAAQWGRRYWVHIGSSGACPVCLTATDSCWQVRWKLAWMFGCLEHQTYLSYRCPACGSRWQGQVKDVRQRSCCCAHTGPSSPRVDGRDRARSTPEDICGYIVKNVVAAPIQSPNTVDLLHRMQRLAEPPDRDLAAVDDDRRIAFDDLLNVCRVVMHVGTRAAFPDDLDSATEAALSAFLHARDTESPRRGAFAVTGYRAYRQVPTDGPLLAAILHVAEPIVTAPNPELLVQRLVSTAAATPSGKMRWGQLQKHWAPPPRLAAAFRQAHLTTYYQHGPTLDGRSRFLRAPAASRVGVRHVPQVLWPPVHRWLVEGVPCLQDGHELPRRRFTAMALARHVSSELTTWEAAAEVLGLASEYASLGKRLSSELHRDPSSAAFAERLASLQAVMNGDHELIDYAARRAALASMRRVPAKAWARALRASGVRQGAASWRWPCQAAAWIWCEVTVGDFHGAPALALANLDPAQRQIEVQAYDNYFVRNHAPRLQPALTELARDVLRRYRLSGEISHVPAIPS